MRIFLQFKYFVFLTLGIILTILLLIYIKLEVHINEQKERDTEVYSSVDSLINNKIRSLNCVKYFL